MSELITSEAFLKRVLPNDGLYCCAVFDKARDIKRQIFYKTIDELAAAILAADKQLTGVVDGGVYHGCASYTTTNRRKQSVNFVKSLWLELDIGADGHANPNGYSDFASALAALVRMCRAVDIPRPLVVTSGHGLHIYWPLAEALKREEWERYAGGLKAAAIQHGFKVEPQRTADIASILRTPGTWNRKTDPPVQVTCSELVDPYHKEEFDGLLEYSNTRGRESDASVLLGPRPAYLVNGHHHKLASFGDISVPSQIDFDALVAGCAQFSAFKETSGNISEPVWHGLVSTLAHAEGGVGIAHQWSAGHPKYTRKETDDRLARGRKLDGPLHCFYFQGLNSLCAGCKFGSSTPLDAGRPVPGPVTQASVEDVAGDDDCDIVPGHSEYQVYNGALCWVNGKSRTKITNFDVRISSVHVGEIAQDQHFYLFKHFQPHVGWRDFTLKAGQVVGEQSAVICADLGVIIHDRIRFASYIRDSVKAIHQRERPQMSFEQFGWKNGNTAFLYGDRLFTSNHEPMITAISPELKYRAQWLRPAPGGSVQGWKDAVDCLMGKGSEGMSFTILASFASILMRFLEPTEGGAVVNLMTRHSGAGKTTSLSGAYTVWASDVRALGLTTIDTKVSKSVSLGALANLPAIYDEFTSKDPFVIWEFIQMFTSGRDKMRCDSAGRIMHTAASWQALLLSANNKSLVDTVQSTGQGDAAAMRILELPVESSGDMKQSELIELAKRMSANGGWAGDTFLRYLMEPGSLSWVQDALPKAVDEVFARCNFRKEHRFWARTLAAVGVAALIVDKLGLISFSPDRIMNWAYDYYSQGTNAPVARGKDTSMLGHLADFLANHLDETLHMPGASEGRKQVPPIGEVPKRRLTIRYEEDTDTVMVNEATLRLWLERNTGGGYGVLLKELESKGILKWERAYKTLGAGTQFISGQTVTMGFDAGAQAFSGFVRHAKKETARENAITRLETYREKRS